MPEKRYQIYVNGKKCSYTYDAQAGVARVRPPGMSQFVTTQSPNADEARADVRGLIEKALGVTAEHAGVRTRFLNDILRVLADPDITDEMIARALGRVNDAVTAELREQLGIGESWRRWMAHLNETNDAREISRSDAVVLADIAIFGRTLD
jgi:hypothetical protein